MRCVCARVCMCALRAHVHVPTHAPAQVREQGSMPLIIKLLYADDKSACWAVLRAY
jgi:hypothetical protein